MCAPLPAGEIFGELVLGMGETLVGNYPGRALSFIVPRAGKAPSGPPRVLAFPSKRVGVFAAGGGVMARSDSSGEDLLGFAGAGLYDSVVCGRGVVERPLVRAHAACVYFRSVFSHFLPLFFCPSRSRLRSLWSFVTC